MSHHCEIVRNYLYYDEMCGGHPLIRNSMLLDTADYC
ncbi:MULTISPECIES: DUF2827 family protein [Burkholderia]|nr:MULTISPECIES: DUF2827 family protein [Burkholderia]